MQSVLDPRCFEHRKIKYILKAMQFNYIIWCICVLKNKLTGCMSNRHCINNVKSQKL